MTATMMRTSYINYVTSNTEITVAERNEIATKMAHSVMQQLLYKKNVKEGAGSGEITTVSSDPLFIDPNLEKEDDEEMNDKTEIEETNDDEHQSIGEQSTE